MKRSLTSAGKGSVSPAGQVMLQQIDQVPFEILRNIFHQPEGFLQE